MTIYNIIRCICIAHGMHLHCKTLYKRKENKKKDIIIYFFTSFKRYIRELQIKKTFFMATIEINVSEFYGVPAYYSEMPRDIFNALETAALNGYKTATVDKAQFDKMMLDFQKKIA